MATKQRFTADEKLRIVEEARTVGAQSAHEALLAGKGLYRDLVRLQFSAESHPRTRSYEE